MSRPVTTRVLGESEYADWTRLVRESPEGSVYATPAYLEALCQAAGGRFRVLAACRGGELLGGVALYERSSPAGPYVAPRLLLYYNGPVLRHYDTRYPSQRTARHLETLTALETALSSVGYARIVLKARPPLTDARVFLARGWRVRPTYTYVVPLDDLEAARLRVEQNLRRLIHRAEQAGLSMTSDGDIDALWRMHFETHERKGSPLYLPERPFRQFVERLLREDLARLFVARLPDGNPAAAQLVLLGPHPVSHTVIAGAHAEHLATGATAFLRWRAFEALAALGYRANDLTDAALNPVTHFKSQLGGALEMTLLITRPERWRVRAIDASSRWGRRVRRVAGAATRRLVGGFRR